MSSEFLWPKINKLWNPIGKFIYETQLEWLENNKHHNGKDKETTNNESFYSHSLKRILEARERLYELIAHCIPAEIIFKVIRLNLNINRWFSFFSGFTRWTLSQLWWFIESSYYPCRCWIRTSSSSRFKRNFSSRSFCSEIYVYLQTTYAIDGSWSWWLLRLRNCQIFFLSIFCKWISHDEKKNTQFSFKLNKD